MRRLVRTLGAGLAATITASLVPSLAAGQGLIRLTPNGNEFGLESRVERWWHDRQAPARSHAVGEWLGLSASGMLMSPGVFSWSGTLRPYFAQQQGAGNLSAFSSRNLGLSVGGNVLAVLPVSLSFHAHRSNGSLLGEAGGASDFRTAGGGALLSWRNSALPVSLEWTNRHTEDSWQSVRSIPSIRRDERVRDVRLQARNSKTGVTLEHVDFDDRLRPLGFRSMDALIEHGVRWGKGSSLQTTLGAGSREGSYAYGRRGGSGRLLLQHTRVASTELYVQRRTGMSGGNPADQKTSGAILRVQRPQGLSASASAAWNRSAFGGGRSSSGAYLVRAAYDRRTGSAGSVSASLGASRESLRQSLSTGGWVEVVEETVTVDESRGFVLEHVRADPLTLVLRDAAGTTLFQLEVDYRLVALGHATRVEILPGGRLRVGDGVLASYRYRPPSDGLHSVDGLLAEVAYSAAWFTIRLSDSWRDADHGKGAIDRAQFAGNDVNVAISARRAIGQARLTVDLQHRDRTRSASDYRSDELRLGVTPAALGSWRGTAGVRGVVSSIGRERMSTVALDGSAHWAVSSLLRLSASGEHTLWLPARSTRELFSAASVDVSWQLGLTETALRYSLQRRVATVDNNQHRLSTRLVRRF